MWTGGWARVPVEAPPTILTEDGSRACWCAAGGKAKHWHRISLAELHKRLGPRFEVVWREPSWYPK